MKIPMKATFIDITSSLLGFRLIKRKINETREPKVIIFRIYKTFLILSLESSSTFEKMKEAINPEPIQTTPKIEASRAV